MCLDKNNNVVQEYDFILLEDEKICQALCCDDETMLYEELKLFKDDILDLANEPNYPDSYKPNELEIISREKAIELLKNKE